MLGAPRAAKLLLSPRAAAAVSARFSIQLGVSRSTVQTLILNEVPKLQHMHPDEVGGAGSSIPLSSAGRIVGPPAIRRDELWIFSQTEEQSEARRPTDNEGAAVHTPAGHSIRRSP